MSAGVVLAVHECHTCIITAFMAAFRRIRTTADVIGGVMVDILIGIGMLIFFSFLMLLGCVLLLIERLRDEFLARDDGLNG